MTLNEMIQAPAAHPYLIIAAGYVAQAAVSALPMPAETSGMFYKWFFAFANGAMINVQRLKAMGNGDKKR